MTELEFPPEEGPIDDAWWAPLAAVAEAIAHNHRFRFFSVDDFMLMYKAVRRDRPDVYAYKHYHLRHYLHVDAAMQTYRYVPARDPLRSNGRYLRHRSLTEAVDRLDLWELPWFKASLEDQRYGLSWDERWQLHPDIHPWHDEGEAPCGHLYPV